MWAADLAPAAAAFAVVACRAVAPEASTTIPPESGQVVASAAWRMILAVATTRTTIPATNIKRPRGLRNPMDWMIAQQQPRVREATR